MTTEEKRTEIEILRKRKKYYQDNVRNAFHDQWIPNGELNINRFVRQYGETYIVPLEDQIAKLESEIENDRLSKEFSLSLPEDIWI